MARVRRRGQVCSGHGKATDVFAGGRDELAQYLGAPPHPGTLNIILNRPLLLRHGAAIAFRGEDVLRRQGFWPATFRGERCLVLRAAWCPLHIVEIVSPRPLRADYGLQNGSVVELEFDEERVERLPIRNLIAWAIMWLPNRRGFFDPGYVNTLHAGNPRAFELAGQPVRSTG